MTRKMLIDTAHPEETRVVVLNDRQIEDFDFETRSRKQLRGNIYLAKVVRVEPSLQSAFVEYGGNRHGFLSFNEIHPDYYQIPIADREALLAEEAADNERLSQNGQSPSARDRHVEDGDDENGAEAHDDDEDALEEEQARRRRRLMRRYKIQEVIRRRQIMLVQVVKEERGNKGAALTSYLSLAGRYGVLMPNTARGGGISRKITALTDRKRLKTVVGGLDVPDGMGLIIRTAGAKRTKAEIKRDYEYLMRLWDNIREVTLKSVAPALIYEEEDLVKRAIRDMFDKDLESIEVEGEDGYREARDFMRMIMPSQAKKIHAWREATPLFVKHKVEEQLASIHSPNVALKSGGYLVINQTEALVAIDVNSGRATRERNIETTALKTNLEAAAETARQLRLRDLAGLIVVDFIDMEESKNNRAVEKVLKDALKDDRARIQTGKISGFGLMEISRQRRRTGLLEGTTHVCLTCSGLGRVRSPESSALATLRAVEAESAKNGAGAVTVRAPSPCGLYLLNEKRAYLARIEASHGLAVTVIIDDSLAQGEHVIERTAVSDAPRPIDAAPALARAEPVEAYDDDVEDEDEAEEIEADEEEAAPSARGGDEQSDEQRDATGGRRRRGRGRGRSRGEPPRAQPAEASDPPPPAETADDDADGRGGRRRRGRRGGRARREDGPADVYSWSRPRAANAAEPYVWNESFPEAPANDAEPAPEVSAEPAAEVAEPAVEQPVAQVEADAAPRRRTRRPRKAVTADAGNDAPAMLADVPPAEVEAPVQIAETVEPPVEVNEPMPEVAQPVASETEIPVQSANDEAAVEPDAPTPPSEPDPNQIGAPPETPRRGWWRRRG